MKCNHIYNRIIEEPDWSGTVYYAIYVCRLCNVKVYLNEGDRIVPPAMIEENSTDE